MKNSLFILFILLIGCHKKVPEEVNSESKLFVGYLKKTFNIDVPDKTTTFLLIPCTGCKGCSDRTFLRVKEGQIDSATIIIICNERHEAEYYIPNSKNKIYYDKKNAMGNYTFGIGYPAFIIMDKKVILEIKYISPMSITDTCSQLQ